MKLMPSKSRRGWKTSKTKNQNFLPESIRRWTRWGWLSIRFAPLSLLIEIDYRFLLSQMSRERVYLAELLLLCYLQAQNFADFSRRHRSQADRQTVPTPPTCCVRLRGSGLELGVGERWQGAVGWFPGDVFAILSDDSGTKPSLGLRWVGACGRDKVAQVQPVGVQWVIKAFEQI